jgi:hypothetical protein
MYMLEMMKCYCGEQIMIEPEINESIEQYINKRQCPKCERIGQWTTTAYTFKKHVQNISNL